MMSLLAFIVIIILFVMFSILVYYLWFWNYYHTHRIVDKNGKELNGPPPKFITGVDVNEYKLHHLHKRLESYTKKYGSAFQMLVMHRPCYITSDPDDVTQILTTKSFDKRMYPEMFDRYLYNKGILFTNNLEHWKVQRTAALHGMMSNAHLNQISIWSEEIVDRLIRSWNNLFDQKKCKELEIEIDEQLTRVALDVIGKAAFSIDINSVEVENSIIGEHFRRIMYVTAAYAFVPPIFFNIYTPKKLKEGETSFAEIRKYVRQIIKERRQSNDDKDHHDLLSILLNYRDENNRPLADDDIILTCFDMFIAGHETTAHTMSWALMLIAKHPIVQEKLHNEVDSVYSSNEGIEKLVPKFSYTQQVINETLRLYPTVPIFTRLSSGTETINNYTLKPMTPVFILNTVLQRNERYWENANSFIPERWSEKSLPLHSYKPFGSGARSCLGQRMAMIEAKVVLSKIMRNFSVKFALPEDTVDESLTITLQPVGLKLVFVPRN